MRIGIDFDNTLAGYDHLFSAIGKEWSLVGAGFAGGKREIRDAIRLLADGEEHWKRLQAQVYGARMAEAELISGAGDFLDSCRRAGAEVMIVSHKTRHAAADPGGVDLHLAAMAWLDRQGFFAADGFGLTRAQVFFEPTREAKCRRVSALGCSHFVDDLDEVFREPSFPAHVERLLLDPSGARPSGPFSAYPSWQAIHDAVFASA